MVQSFIRRQARRLAAIGLVLLLFVLVPRPQASEPRRQALAQRFRFQRTPLPEVAGKESRHIRPVHPSLRGIDGWISSVGGAVALADLDGDGIANDVCYVETRTDQVIVAMVPGVKRPAGSRDYAPYSLETQLFDRRTMAPMGCLPGDFNEDGVTDLIVYYWGRTPLLFLRHGDGYEASELVPGGARWFTDSATQADFDGDGHVDLLFANYFPDGSRILDADAGGGESMQRSMSRAFNGGDKHLLLWSPETPPRARFVEATDWLPAEARNGWTLAVGAQDLDGDLLPEIYLANDFGPDRLLHNRSQPGAPRFTIAEGRSGFSIPESKVLGHDSFKGMGVDFGDLNGDGIPDIYVSNIAAEYALEESHFAFISTAEKWTGNLAPYVDRSEPLGLSRSSWSWDTRLADLDNDGVLEAMQATGFQQGSTDRWPELQELAMGNDDLLEHPASWPRFGAGDDLCGHARNPLFVRDGDRYVDIAKEVGFGESSVSRGIATADVDGDGDLDIAVGNQWGPSSFYLNQCPNCGRSLELRLLIPLTPKELVERAGLTSELRGWPAIGASVTVRRADGRVLIGQVDGGNGHSGKREPLLHFGLGADERPVSVDIRWRQPGGREDHQQLTLAPGPHTISLRWTEGGR